MRGTLLVYGPTDPAYLPLLRALGAHGFRLHILPNALVEPARAAGIDADDALAVLDAAARARVREARAALAARLRGLDVQLQAIFTAGPLALWDGMREAASAALVEAGEQVAVMAAVVDALAARGQLDGIVLGYDTLPAGRAAVETGRRLGVPTVLVPHAVLPRPRVAMPWQGARLFADVVCAPGAFSRAGYLAHGAAPDAVVPTGCPRWDESAGLDEAGRPAAPASPASP